MHGICDALGNPLDFILTPGQSADCKQAVPLLKNKEYDTLLADKGYDTDEIVVAVAESEALCVIPPKKNRKVQREYDQELYKERHKIECLFGFLKHYRRIFSRFEKIASRFQAFLHLAAALQWLK